MPSRLETSGLHGFCCVTWRRRIASPTPSSHDLALASRDNANKVPAPTARARTNRTLGCIPDVAARSADLRRIEQQDTRVCRARRKPLTSPETCHPPTTEPWPRQRLLNGRPGLSAYCPEPEEIHWSGHGVATMTSHRIVLASHRTPACAFRHPAWHQLPGAATFRSRPRPRPSDDAAGSRRARLWRTTHIQITPEGELCTVNLRCGGLPGEHSTRNHVPVCSTRELRNASLEETPRGDSRGKLLSAQLREAQSDDSRTRELRGSGPERKAPVSFSRRRSSGGALPKGRSRKESSWRKSPEHSGQEHPARRNPGGRLPLANSRRSGPEGRLQSEDPEHFQRRTPRGGIPASREDSRWRAPVGAAPKDSPG
jgi:hypothetical protein